MMKALGSKYRIYKFKGYEDIEEKAKHTKHFLTWDHPDLVTMFLKHCEDGWSPRSFCKYLRCGQKGFDLIRATNPEFERINRMYAKNGACKNYEQSKGL